MSLPGERGSESKGILLDDALRAYLGTQGLGRAAALGAVAKAWPELIGPGLVGHVAPWRIEGETLLVAVDDPALATELTFLSSRLLEGLESHVGATGISAIKAVVKGNFGIE